MLKLHPLALILLSIVALAVERAWRTVRRKGASDGTVHARFGMWAFVGFGLVDGLGFGSAFACRDGNVRDLSDDSTPGFRRTQAAPAA